MCKTLSLHWLSQSLSYSQSSHSDGVIIREVLQGFSPQILQIRRRHEGYFTDVSLLVHPLRCDGRNQTDICNNHMRPSHSPNAILKTERPWCPGYKAGWNVQSEIENSLSLLLIVDSNLVSVLILLFPSMPHKFKIVDHFQRIRETYFALVQVCKFLVRQEAGFITYLLGIRFSSFLPINPEIS